MTYPIIYKATVYYETNNYEPQEVHGILFAESFADAAAKIERYYGTDTDRITMTLLEDGEVLEIDAEMAEKLIAEYH